MKRFDEMSLYWIFILCIIGTVRVHGQKINIDNPVLPGVADAGVIKYNGEYYIGGVFTNGGFYISRDLVKWEGPVHVFSMNNNWTTGPSAEDRQIHANDINYINGIFHMYWSVNYWGKDRNAIHIGHAVASNVLGPYKEPVKETWLDNRIDPELFIDDDGKMYLYMVKFTDGNTIWVQPMKDPGTPSGEPRYMFSSLPNTWETLDNRVEEGPWVIKYRNRYYLMYNANHTSPSWGNYSLGVAEAESPLAFNHGNKYSYPLVESNQFDMEDSLVDVLKYTGKEPGVFDFTFDDPGNNGFLPVHNSTTWKKGKGGFASSVIRNSYTRKVGTIWNTPQIWLKRTFMIDKKRVGNLMLRIQHDGDTRVFLNGQLIYDQKGQQYTTWNFDHKAASLLKHGENLLVVHSKQGVRSNYLDVSLFDTRGQKGDDILFSPGQPNILRGPNGFEWWLIYMANKNRDRRGQYINRVHFFNKTMFVEGITSNNTPGYHPAPAVPTFSDLFDSTDARKWEVRSGDWSVSSKELVQVGNNKAINLVKTIPATHYLFEANLSIIDTANGKAGVLAWWKDEYNWLQIVLDPQGKTWTYKLKENGAEKTVSTPLYSGFNFGVYHKLSIFKNGTTFTIKLDDLPVPGNAVMKTGFEEKGIPGLYSEGGKSSFDGVLFTIGWDEFDSNITAWQPQAEQKGRKGSWMVAEDGITAPANNANYDIFKGDPLSAYEFSVQVNTSGTRGNAGIYPVYVNKENYLKAVFDMQKQRFVITGKLKGKELEQKELVLERSLDYYVDMKYTDFFEKQFTFSTPTMINGLRLNKTPHAQPDTVIENIDQKMNILYKQAGQWLPLEGGQELRSGHPGIELLACKPVVAEALKFVNKDPEDQNFYLNKIWVNELFRSSYNIRVVKQEKEIIFLINGKEVIRLKNEFPASRVGLTTTDTRAGFNGITLFHLP
ncbi:family 43 glycosylhydrolase [Chitinophagaceae bacterium LB-8]|uniref:Family 43 glycosylhydrolase n=1 Tax=Paraflavisolibacter caeni TaxID=2982496 RepID=A0A9X2Y004_9BACT|nr:family 43 glycosylhydrolase [Paraflavisolibacter caeni]MCU7551852.1 family 43 glycosylhydrolase [Paraflavisolibacter caeni]